MKTLIFISILSLMTIVSSNGPITKDQTIEVGFNHTFTFNELVKTKLDLAESGITLRYKRIVFDDQGGLLEIGFEVNCNDGFKGAASTSNLTNQSKFGFSRNYNNSIPFSTGDLLDE